MNEFKCQIDAIIAKFKIKAEQEVQELCLE